MAAKQKQKLTAPATIESIGEDLLQCILSRLPAESCASAAFVNRCWNLIITRLLTLPNLSSALSRHPCLQGAVDEVLDKVLARPIRPQFVIASIGPSFNLEEAHCRDEDIDINPVLAKWDYAFSSETAIVGDAGSQFYYQGGTTTNRFNSSAAVALLFSRDIGKPPGLGETQFHVMLSTGVSPIGPKYEAVYVKAESHDNSTRLMATTKELDINMDGETILDPIYDELGDHTHSQTLYVGVRKTRKCNSRCEDTRWIRMHEFHLVLRGDYEYLYVHGDGIKNYNSFQFYHANPDLARATCNNVSNNMKLLKQDLNHLTDDHSNSNGSILCIRSLFLVV